MYSSDAVWLLFFLSQFQCYYLPTILLYTLFILRYPFTLPDFLLYLPWLPFSITSGSVPQDKPRQREPTFVKANLTRVTLPPNPTMQADPVISSLYPSVISLSSFAFPGAPYRTFLLLLPCHFHFVVITTTTIFILPTSNNSRHHSKAQTRLIT